MLRYGLKDYPVGVIIHVLVGGYSYRAEVIEELEKQVRVRLVETDVIHVIPKSNTFQCSCQNR